ncbi:MAG: heavy metal translocating P-type ATPase [Ignavibacteria bacterium]|nr:heavy metal translocating P-type ATPase [Ignavibacteria bacterium]
MAIKKNRPDSFEEIELDVAGMECVNCANSIKTYLEKLNGIYNVEVNFTSEVASVEYNPHVIEIKEIVKDIRKLGYDVIEEDDEDKVELQKKKHLRFERNNIFFAIFLSIIIMTVSMSGHHGFYDLKIPMNQGLAFLFILTSIIVFWNGKKFIVGAYHSARNKTSDMNTLVSMGVLSSYIYSSIIAINHIFKLNIYALRNSHEVYFETAAMIITLILTGNYLESVLKSKTQTSIKKLKELQSKFVNIIRGGSEMLVPYNKVRVNDTVIVKSGDKIPVDGQIVEGYCVIDESAMTGESVPVEKKTGDNLISGTLMKNGFVKMNAVKVGQNTTLSRIISLVKEASNSKPKIQRLADKISAIFVPVVVSISIITFVIWRFIIGIPFDESLLFAVSVLVIACPCALGLASPMAIVIGVGRAAENGILFNNVESIENIIKVDTICFDKTGTLTTGEMEINNIRTYGSITNDELMKNVFSVEKYSNHPLAKSIVNYCLQIKADISENVEKINNEEGLGISGFVDNKEVLIGSYNLMEKHNVLLIDIPKPENAGILFVSINKSLAGSIEFEDKIKPEAKDTIARIKKMKLGLFLISGDSEAVTSKVAKELDIDNFSFKTFPEDKEKIVSELQSRNKNVAMIGDGINDAPSLARANVGMAVGTGQDIAIDSADVILVKGDLRNVIKSINISSRTVSIIKQNIFWAFFYNAITIPAAAGLLAPFGIVISPVMAAMFMAFSDVVTVMINSLRLKYVNIN